MSFSSMNRWIKFILVFSIINDLAISPNGANSIAPVTKQPFNERNCKKPQSRIAYLGKFCTLLFKHECINSLLFVFKSIPQ